MKTIFCDNCEEEIPKKEGIKLFETETTGELIVCSECNIYYNEN